MQNWFVKTGKELYKENYSQETTVEVGKIQVKQSSHNRVGWCIHQNVEIICYEDSLETNKSVSVSDWETISNYYSESENDSLPGLVLRRLVNSGINDYSSIESTEENEESDDDFLTRKSAMLKTRSKLLKKESRRGNLG